jgi:integrase
VTSHGCLHKLRHTAALQYLRGAKDSFLLQLFLRHESLEMSRRYTRGLKAEEAIEAHRNGASPVEGLGLG